MSQQINASGLEKAVCDAEVKEWQMTQEDEQILLDKAVTLPMDFKQLKRYLPHRYPFMLIDRVLECTPNERII